MGQNVKEISDSEFEAEVLKSAVPVLVDFWAPWCAPCKNIAPVLEEIASDYAGKIKIVKLNTDENPRSPEQYNVKAIPNLVLFRDGAVIERIVGAVPKAHLSEVLSKVA